MICPKRARGVPSQDFPPLPARGEQPLLLFGERIAAFFAINPFKVPERMHLDQGFPKAGFRLRAFVLPSDYDPEWFKTTRMVSGCIPGAFLKMVAAFRWHLKASQRKPLLLGEQFRAMIMGNQGGFSFREVPMLRPPSSSAFRLFRFLPLFSASSASSASEAMAGAVAELGVQHVHLINEHDNDVLQRLAGPQARGSGSPGLGEVWVSGRGAKQPKPPGSCIYTPGGLRGSWAPSNGQLSLWILGFDCQESGQFGLVVWGFEPWSL